MAPSTLFVLLLSIAMATALVARLAKLPYPVALVLAGLGLGTLGVITPPHLTKELLFTVFLPGLLFEAAFHLDFEAVRRQWQAIAVLAIPGVLAAILITAAIVGVAFPLVGIGIGFGFAPAFIFGALVAATDPVAVSALFRALHAPADLSAIIEGESLLNDGTSVVFLSLIIAAATGGNVTAGHFAGEFVLVAGGGAVIGAAVAAGLCEVIRRVDDAMIEITLTMIAAYGSFVAAEQCHASGVIATVVAGMLCGVRGRRAGMSPNTRAAVTIFWEYVAFALNSVVFLLIGFEVALTDLVRACPAVLIAYVAMMLARAVVVFGFGAAQRKPRIPRSWSAVITWGGLRGALSMVLALALPAALPHRTLLIDLTVGVVLLSLLVQGLSMPLLLKQAGLASGQSREEGDEYDDGRGEHVREERVAAGAPAPIDSSR